MGVEGLRAITGFNMDEVAAAAGDDPDVLRMQNVAATHMRGWGGEVADRHVRFVFSREPVDRPWVLGDRVRAALDK